MRVFVDTSALIALLDEDDARHREASATLRSLARTAELVTHNYVHVEALGVATRRLESDAAQRLIDSIFPIMTTIWVSEALHRTALESQRTAGGAVSLVDHVSFAVMRDLGIDVAFAFDADFDRHGFSRPPVAPEVGEGRGVSEAPGVYAGSAIEQPDLVSVAEIAIRAGRPVNTIQSWRRRHPDFPAPVARLSAGPIWNWSAVADWISARASARVASAA